MNGKLSNMEALCVIVTVRVTIFLWTPAGINTLNIIGAVRMKSVIIFV